MKTLEQMAEEAGYDVFGDDIAMKRIGDLGEPMNERAHLLRFAALVAERCAEIAAVCRAPTNEREEGYYAACKECAEAILAEFPKP